MWGTLVVLWLPCQLAFQDPSGDSHVLQGDIAQELQILKHSDDSQAYNYMRSLDEQHQDAILSKLQHQAKEHSSIHSFTFLAALPEESTPGTAVVEDVNSTKARSADVRFVIRTTTKYHENRMSAIKDTWGKRIADYITFSDVDDTSVPTKGVQCAPDHESGLCCKTAKSLIHVLTEMPPARWIFVADDDIYVHVDHLMDYLSTLDHLSHLYVGHTCNSPVAPNVTYACGGAGYALSYPAFVSLVSKPDFYDRIMHTCANTNCSEGCDDVAIGNEMNLAGIMPTDNARQMHTMPPAHYAQLAHAPDVLGTNPITFHYIRGEEMRVLDRQIMTSANHQSSSSVM